MTLPRNLVARPDRASIHLSWEPPEQPPYAYEVSLDGGGTWTSTGTDALAWSREGLARGTRLRISVRARYASGPGEPTPIIDIRLPTSLIEASTALLIGQWRNAARLQATIDIIIAAFRERIETPHQRLQAMTLIDQAEGVWLDHLAARVGVNRPYLTGSLIGADHRFGFDDSGVGFDSQPYRGDSVNDAYFPMPDPIFRRLLRARAALVISPSRIADMQAAVRHLDPGAAARDNLDMRVIVWTDFRWLVQLADDVGALPRPAGVRLEIRDRGRFGFDQPQRGFDQGPYGA